MKKRKVFLSLIFVLFWQMSGLLCANNIMCFAKTPPITSRTEISSVSGVDVDMNVNYDYKTMAEVSVNAEDIVDIHAKGYYIVADRSVEDVEYYGRSFEICDSYNDHIYASFGVDNPEKEEIVGIVCTFTVWGESKISDRIVLCEEDLFEENAFGCRYFLGHSGLRVKHSEIGKELEKWAKERLQ